MRYSIDAEFIDEPGWSELISFAIVSEEGESLYFELDYPEKALSPWLIENVVPLLTGEKTTLLDAANQIREFVGKEPPEFWCYYGAYDWYWLCRLFGGFLRMPKDWQKLYSELASYQEGSLPNLFGPEHNALNDAKSIMAAVKRLGE